MALRQEYVKDEQEGKYSDQLYFSRAKRMSTMSSLLTIPSVFEGTLCHIRYISISYKINKLIKSRTYCSANSTQSQSETSDTEDIRNVSRMPSNQYKQYYRQPPEMLYKDLTHQKKLYATYGKVSGEDARILWPTRKKLLDLEQEEKEEGKPFFERLAQIESEKKLEGKMRLERHQTIEKNMAQMSKLIAEYRNKHEKAATAAKERDAKKEALLEEAREHFGYKIQANDPKFQQMLADKEEKEKKEAKKKKKEEKLKKMTAYLTKTEDKKEEKTK
ncbi:hypothetical protein Btru_022484 [Bulinus truncatus]|nr:hypothetical protein Btru_022484 [Bulinus truncatus]